MPRMRIGDMLVKAGLIDEMQLQSALSHQRQWGGKLGDILVQLGFLDEMMLWRGLSRQLDVPLVSLAEFPIPQELVSTIPVDMAVRLEIVPIALEDRSLTIATSDPNNIGALDEVAFRTGLKVKTVLAPAREVEWAIRSRYHGDRSACPPPRQRRQVNIPAPDQPNPDAALQIDSGPVASARQLRQDGPKGLSRAATPLGELVRGATPAPTMTPMPNTPGTSWPPQPTTPPQPQHQQPGYSGTLPPGFVPAGGWQPAPPDGARAMQSGLSAEDELRQANEMLRALVELCIQRGVFTREELWDRLSRR